MESFKLEWDFSQAQEIQGLFSQFQIMTQETMPNTSKAVHKAAQYVQNRWSEYLAGGELPNIDKLENPVDPSKTGLRIEDKGAFNSEVVTSSKKVVEIQEGADPVFYDMKQTHPYGRRSRVSKKGIPYLIIPFRWGTPNGKGTARRWNNVIPQKEYNTYVNAMKLSRTTDKTHIEANAKGEPQTRAEYIWKSRLKEDMAWDDRSEGMVRMRDSASGKSTFFTFRVISAKSPAGSWLYWKDGKDPIDMLGALQKDVEPTISQIIENGIRADLGI